MTCYGCPNGCSRCDDDYERKQAERRIKRTYQKTVQDARAEVLELVRALITDWPALQKLQQLEAELRAEGKL
jgi:GTP1/Obg family GTP-binding protein